MLSIILNVFNFLSSILFYEVFGLPLMVIWLIAAIFFISFKLKFPNVRFFKHGLDVALRNKYYSKDDIGDITPKQALLTSIAGSVGLGNISGVAIAITIGGPGAVFWMIVYCFFAMNIVFIETTLSQLYRHVDSKGKISGGPFRYLKSGLEELGYKKFGSILAVFFCVMLVFGTIGGTMFQINQTIKMLTDYSIFKNLAIVFSALFASLCLYTLINGIKAIGKIIEKIIPVVFVLYILCAIIILVVNYRSIPSSLLIIIKDAMSGSSAVGGFLGMVVIAIRRISYASEAGLGTASIGQSTAKTKEPIRQATVASLIPLFGTALFCFLTAIIIVTSGAYKVDAQGILITKNAFLTVSPWFPALLSIIITMIATSYMLSTSFFGQSAWKELFKCKYVFVFNTIYIIAILISTMIDLNNLLNIIDTFALGISIPNLIGVYMLSGVVKRKMLKYSEDLKNGEFDKKS